MWWRKKRAEKPIREQLEKARVDLQRQIEILDAGPTPGAYGATTDNTDLISNLTAELREIDDALAKPESDNA